MKALFFLRVVLLGGLLCLYSVTAGEPHANRRRQTGDDFAQGDSEELRPTTPKTENRTTATDSINITQYSIPTTSDKQKSEKKWVLWPWRRGRDGDHNLDHNSGARPLHQAPEVVSVGGRGEEKFKTDERNKNDKKAKQQESSKRGRRKMMTNCRHLATPSWESSSYPRLSRLWRRLLSPLRRRYSSSKGDMSVAYVMGVAASLSYWDFHKKPLPGNRTAYEVITLKTGSPQPILRRREGSGRKRRRIRRVVVSTLQIALDEAQPWLNPLPVRKPRHQRRRKIIATTDRQQQRQPGVGTRRQKLQRVWRDEGPDDTRHYQQHRIQLEFSFYNWYEPTPLGNYHDTDLLLGTSHGGKHLIVAFAGTASVPDTVTNLQTFEPARHSKLFSSVVEGSIHRGFLNAYSRVEKGSVLRLCDDSCTLASTSLYQRYGHCTAQDDGAASPGESSAAEEETNAGATKSMDERHGASQHLFNETLPTSESNPHKAESIERKKGRRGCKVRHNKLMTILREIVTDYLSSGRSVLLAGHSLGGSLATLHALDIIINFSRVPLDNLRVWTFGEAQVADDAFLRSALTVAPRLQQFLQEGSSTMGAGKDDNSNRRTANTTAANHRVAKKKGKTNFHRFVTVSDDCQVDFVSTVAQKTLAPDNESNLHGKAARKLGGIQGSVVVHLTDPHYLLTPDQYDVVSSKTAYNKGKVEQQHGAGWVDGTKPQQEQVEEEEELMVQATDTDTGGGASEASSSPPKASTTRSTLAAHSTRNYLTGISRESEDHPLSTDLPQELRSWLGEICWAPTAS